MNYRIKLNGSFEFPMESADKKRALEEFQKALKYIGTMEDPTYDILFLIGEKGWQCQFYFLASFIFESNLDKEEAAAEFLEGFEHLGEPIDLDYEVSPVKFHVIKKEPGKDPEVVEVDVTYLCDLAKLFFGDHVTMQRIALDRVRTFWLLVDEDGLLKDLPRNFLLPMGGFHPVQKIVGTAIFARSKPADIWNKEIYDYEVDDLNEKYQQAINAILSDNTQQALASTFEDYRSGFTFITQV